MTQYNWKGQGYESLEALRTHLLYFDWPIVELFKKEGKTGSENADAALKLAEIPDSRPTKVEVSEPTKEPEPTNESKSKSN